MDKIAHSHVKEITHRPKISHITHAFIAIDTTPLEMFSNMQRSQKKRCAPSWLKQKPYRKIRFTQDGVTTKVTESWRIKLRQYSQELSGSLANYPFRVSQAVWCYWKTANEKEKAYFEAHITEVWDNTAEVLEISSTEVDEISSDEFVENNDIEGEGEISHFLWVSSALKNVP